MGNNEELFNLYVEEAREHLENIDENLLALEKEPDSPDRINALFRSVHTIKGSTAAMNYTRQAEFVHRVEDLMQQVREGRRAITDGLVEFLFSFHDVLEKFIDDISEGGQGSVDGIESLYEQAVALLKNETAVPAQVKQEPIETAVAAGFKIPEHAAGDIEKLLSGGSQVHAARVKISDNCLFLNVRAWMAFEEINQDGRILTANPQVPTADEYADSEYCFPSRIIDFICESEMSEEEFYNKLSTSLSEIDYVKVAPLSKAEEGISGKYLAFDKTNKAYFLDFDKQAASGGSSSATGELQEKIRAAGVAYLELKFAHDSEHLKILLEVVADIAKLSAQLSDDHLRKLADATFDLLALCLEKGCCDNNVYATVLLDSIELMNALVSGSGVPSDQDAINSEKHCGVIKGIIGKDFYKYIACSDEETQKRADEYKGDKFGEILVKQGVIESPVLQEMLDIQKTAHSDMKLGQVLVNEGKASVKEVSEALKIQESSRVADSKSGAFVRIPEHKVDSLVEYMGELLVLQALLKENITQGMGEKGNAQTAVMNDFERMERIIKELQSMSMSLRMVSLKQTLQKMQRIARDTAKELGKDVEIDIIGEDTEIDRSVVDKLQDPLMHLVRNSISHGIEPAEDRVGAGKAAKGNVQIKAYNKRGNVYIEVVDDGRGLDTAKLMQKAVEKNLVTEGRSYTDSEIINFIFLPGFSTQEKVNNISGRGVGMNVVETEIKKIGGKIEIKNRPGEGSDFILKIPVNLATLNGTIVDIVGQKYIIPTLNVKQILNPKNEQWIGVRGSLDRVRIREDIISLVHIDRILGLPREDCVDQEKLVVIIEHENEKRALPVNNVIGRQEVVLKPLSQEFQNLDFVSGATILGDGRVALILEMGSMFTNNLQ